MERAFLINSLLSGKGGGASVALTSFNASGFPRPFPLPPLSPKPPHLTLVTALWAHVTSLRGACLVPGAQENRPEWTASQLS